MAAEKLRLIVKQVHVRWAAFHEKQNHPFSAWLEMGRLGS
jgi:hypothetical protein